MIGFGIIGAGLMGKHRANALLNIEGVELRSAFDPDRERAAALPGPAAGFGVESSYQAVLERKDVDAVVIAVPHFLAAEMVEAAFQAGKHVLCEKPLGRNTRECWRALSVKPTDKVFCAGFNYRYYPAIREAKRLIGEGVLGELTHMRFMLGHGGRPGMEKEWKVSRELCGGGALLDPGIHAIDLVRHLAGDVEEASASLFRSFWPIDVCDNAFVQLRTAGNRHAQLHVSITEWKSRFAMELCGTNGMLEIRGRSGTYGAQRFLLTPRWHWLDKTAKTPEFVHYPPEDTSFAAEVRAFVNAIGGQVDPAMATALDAVAALELVDSIYEASRTKLDSFRPQEVVSLAS